MKDVASGGGGAMAFGPGPKVAGAAGIGMGLGTGKDFGSGGSGSGFGGRGSGSRKAMLATGGGTKHTERAVTAALVWLANHQTLRWQLEPATLQDALHRQDLHRRRRVRPMPARRQWACCPSWPPGKRTSPKAHTRNISSKASTGSSVISSPMATWPRAQQMMYSHGLATIALCEAYGLTGDRASRPGGAGGRELHPRRPERGRRRLAVHAQASPATPPWSVGN